MAMEEEVKHLQEQLRQRDELIQQQQELIGKQQALMEHMREQISGLNAQVKSLRDQISKNSHNSSLPPSSDRFVRQPKSLRPKSEKKTGGQEGHRGTTLPFSDAPDARD
jgi:transposase